MYRGGGKGRCAGRACGCGVGEGAGWACASAAVAARLRKAPARKHFCATLLNSKRDCMAVSQDLLKIRWTKRREDSGITLSQKQARRFDSSNVGKAAETRP